MSDTDDSQDDFDWTLIGPTTRRPFAEQFLLAIIDANTPETLGLGTRRASRKRRLSVAMRALFGPTLVSKKGRKAVDDRRALYRMALELHRDLAAISAAKLGFKPKVEIRKPRSMRALAKAAALRTYGAADDATVDRLREAFADPKVSEVWMEMVRSHDDVRESVEDQILQSLQNTLAKVGIAMKLG